MTVAELTAIVDDQLKAANARRTMRRDALSAIRFVPDFATIVMGVRRCGKSTLAAQCRKSFDGAVLALNFDDLRMMNFAAEDFRALDKVIEARGRGCLSSVNTQCAGLGTVCPAEARPGL